MTHRPKICKEPQFATQPQHTAFAAHMHRDAIVISADCAEENRVGCQNGLQCLRGQDVALRLPGAQPVGMLGQCNGQTADITKPLEHSNGLGDHLGAHSIATQHETLQEMGRHDGQSPVSRA